MTTPSIREQRRFFSLAPATPAREQSMGLDRRPWHGWRRPLSASGCNPLGRALSQPMLRRTVLDPLMSNHMPKALAAAAKASP